MKLTLDDYIYAMGIFAPFFKLSIDHSGWRFVYLQSTAISSGVFAEARGMMWSMCHRPLFSQDISPTKRDSICCFISRNVQPIKSSEDPHFVHPLPLKARNMRFLSRADTANMGSFFLLKILVALR